MFNKNSSAGTAAKKRSKCSGLARLPLLSAILLLCAVSCKDKPKPLKAVEPKPFVPLIKQDIWHSDDGFHLQTYVLTDSFQLHPSSKDKVYWGDKFAPYNNEIKGDFNYIKNNKSSEYKKAHLYLYEYPDSVNMLHSVPVK